MLFFFLGIIFIAGGVLLQGLRRIPNNPPHKAVVTVLGKRTARVKDEGWRFFFLHPFIFGYVLVNVSRISKEFSVSVRTPDRAESSVPIAITFRPLTELLVPYLNNSGEEGVTKQLQGKIEERVREWTMADEEGPQNWKELQKSRLEAASVLTKTIGANYITIIPDYAQDVPTVIWMRYFTKPRPEPSENTPKNERKWMEDDWTLVKNVYEPLGDTEKRELEEDVKKRMEEIKALRAGSGNIKLGDLGITIERLNIADIKLLGEVARAAEMEAKEVQEREAEKLELEHVRLRLGELKAEGFSNEQSLEIIQTERGKVKKEISESKFNISPETREMVEKIIPAIAGAFGKGGKP